MADNTGKRVTPSAKQGFTPLTFDMKRYDQYLDSYDMSEDEKQKVLQALWSIMISFVDMGFGIDTTQAVCGKLLESAFEITSEDKDTVK